MWLIYCYLSPIFIEAFVVWRAFITAECLSKRALISGLAICHANWFKFSVTFSLSGLFFFLFVFDVDDDDELAVTLFSSFFSLKYFILEYFHVRRSDGLRLSLPMNSLYHR